MRTAAYRRAVREPKLAAMEKTCLSELSFAQPAAVCTLSAQVLAIRAPSRSGKHGFDHLIQAELRQTREPCPGGCSERAVLQPIFQPFRSVTRVALLQTRSRFRCPTPVVTF